MSDMPVEIEGFKALFSALMGISLLVLIPSIAVFILWVIAHAKIASKAGYPVFFGIIASVFPLIYFVFAFSRWPIEERLIHLSGERHKYTSELPLAPNSTRKK